MLLSMARVSLQPPTPVRSGLGERFHEEAKKNPRKTALICGEESVTYEALDRSVARLAQWLFREGLLPGDRVAIFWFNEIPAVTLYLACFRAGLIALPIIWRMKASELNYILGHAKPGLCFAHPKLAAVAAEAQKASGHACRILHALPADLPELDEAKLPEVEPAKPALIIYTSGTTARPKGVTHTHRTLGAAVEIMWDLGGNGISVTTTSIMHPSGLYCIVLPAIMAGDTVVLVPVFEPNAVLDAIERHQCTSCIFLPSMAQFVVVEQMKRPRVVSSMRWIIAGGDSVPVALQQQFQAAFGVPLREGIAMTECCPMLANPFDAMRPGSVGLPMSQTEARVVNGDGHPLPDGEIGELAVRSPGNFTGYWNNPEETAAALRDGWLFTGDLVRRDAEGYFWFQGRKKQIIVRDSYNVAPQEVEEALYKNPAVLEAGVIGQPDPVFGEKVVAYVSLRAGQSTTEVELREFARQHLNDLKVPEKILFLAELPKGLSGKVDRRALKEMALP
jgi:long-chain acyl-CoA synthetase